MDVYHAQKVICVTEVQIQTSLLIKLITTVKFVRKEIIVLKVPQIIYLVHQALLMPTKVWAHYSNAHFVKSAHTILILALKDAIHAVNLQQVPKGPQNVLVKVKTVSFHLLMALVDANLVLTSKQPRG
jgi:hypothetical protein